MLVQCSGASECREVLLGKTSYIEEMKVLPEVQYRQVATYQAHVCRMHVARESHACRYTCYIHMWQCTGKFDLRLMAK